MAVAVHLAASASGNQALIWATKPLLMPLLALWVWRAAPRSRGIIAALLFSAAGDVALLLPGTAWFIAGMALFLGAHLCYIVTFVHSGARPKPVIAAIYGLVYLSGLVWLWKPLGAMAFPMAFYGLALVGMATLAASINPVVGAGGALFLISDFMIAIDMADAVALPGPPIWAMLTYVAGQTLIATGWRQYTLFIHQRTASTYSGLG
jgi:uncharacterized membrane protein YhhN